jgi:ATP-binding cassette, subfamily B, bacterial PglK
MSKTNLFGLYATLWNVLPLKRNLQILFLIVLSGFAALCEMISIASVLPFLFILMGEEAKDIGLLPIDIGYLLSLTNSNDPLFGLSILFISAVLVSGLVRILLTWMQGIVSSLVGVDLSRIMLDSALSRSVFDHRKYNTSEIIAAITNKTTVVVFQVILPTMAIFGSITIISGIILSLIFVDTKIAAISFGVFGIIYFIIFLTTRTKLYNYSEITNTTLNDTLQTLQEIFGGYADLLIYKAQDNFKRKFNQKNFALRNSQAMSFIIGNSPKYFIEAASICIFILIALSTSTSGESNLEIVPIFGAFALAAHKILPALQQIYGGAASIKGADAVFRELVDIVSQKQKLSLKDADFKNFKFYKSLALKNVSFRHNEDNFYIFQNISLEINPGDFVGIYGPSGSGKSSLISLIMGFDQASQGEVLMDGVPFREENAQNWYEKFSYVSQNVFLLDGTIAENIAFGINYEDIDFDKINKVIKQARLNEFLLTCKEGIFSKVGELGARISGGEKQRIAIARALYKGASILIFDEATSALDFNMEKEIMASINLISINFTIILVAHRLSTLKKCNKTYLVENNKVVLKRLPKNLY